MSAPKVKPLVWEYRTFDQYAIWSADKYDIWVGADYHRIEGIRDDVRLYPNLEAAKAAAQADYEARILAALEPAAPTWHRMDDAEVMTHPKVVEFVKAISGYVSAIAAFDGSGNMTDKIARLEGCASSLAAAVSGVTPAPAEGGEG